MGETSQSTTFIRNFAAVTTIVLALGTASWTVFQTYSRIQSIETRVGSIDMRVEKLENAGPVTPSGGNSDLADRLNALDARLKALEARPAASAGGASPTAPITIQSDYGTDFPTKTINGFLDVSLQGCQWTGKTAIRCALIVKTSRDTPGLYLYANENANYRSRAYPPNGQEIRAAQITIDNRGSERSLNRDFPKDVPVQVLLDFEDIPEDSPGLLRLELGMWLSRAGVLTATFEEVAITRP